MGYVDWTQLEPIRQSIFQTLKINHVNYIAWSENTMVIIKFPRTLEKIKRDEYLCVTWISPWHARSLRDHELSQDGAIKPANTGNSFHFLVRILAGWAGQSLPFKSPHLCIFTAWLADKFQNKRQQAFPPEKHSPWNDEWQAQQKQGLFVVLSFLPSFEEGFVFTVGRCAVPRHTDEFSGALSLNLREQGLQSGGKQLGKTAADCNHLLTVWPRY